MQRPRNLIKTVHNDAVTGPPPPQHCPSARELDDIELLAHGVFGVPARLEGPSGPVELVLPQETSERAQAAGAVEIVDPEGVPLAQVSVSATYPAGDGAVGITGELASLQHHEFGAFRNLYLSPGQTRSCSARMPSPCRCTPHSPCMTSTGSAPKQPGGECCCSRSPETGRRRMPAAGCRLPAC